LIASGNRRLMGQLACASRYLRKVAQSQIAPEQKRLCDSARDGGAGITAPQFAHLKNMFTELFEAPVPRGRMRFFIAPDGIVEETWEIRANVPPRPGHMFVTMQFENSECAGDPPDGQMEIVHYSTEEGRYLQGGCCFFSHLFFGRPRLEVVLHTFARVMPTAAWLQALLMEVFFPDVCSQVETADRRSPRGRRPHILLHARHPLDPWAPLLSCPGVSVDSKRFEESSFRAS
jgi:hypothetical protein